MMMMMMMIIIIIVIIVKSEIFLGPQAVSLFHL